MKPKIMKYHDEGKNIYAILDVNRLTIILNPLLPAYKEVPVDSWKRVITDFCTKKTSILAFY